MAVYSKRAIFGRQLTRSWATFLAACCVTLGQSPPQYEKWITTFAARTAELLTLDSKGRIYLAGLGFDNFPVTPNAFAPTTPSPLFPQGYLLQLDPTGSTVLYGTFLIG